MKLKEFGPPGGGARPKFYYVDPPLIWSHITTSSLMHRNAFAVAVCALYLNIFALYLCHTLSVCQLLDSKHTFPVADPGFSKWGGTVLSQMGGRTSCFQVKSA